MVFENLFFYLDPPPPLAYLLSLILSSSTPPPASLAAHGSSCESPCGVARRRPSGGGTPTWRRPPGGGLPVRHRCPRRARPPGGAAGGGTPAWLRPPRRRPPGFAAATCPCPGPTPCGIQGLPAALPRPGSGGRGIGLAPRQVLWATAATPPGSATDAPRRHYPRIRPSRPAPAAATGRLATPRARIHAGPALSCLPGKRGPGWMGRREAARRGFPRWGTGRTESYWCSSG
ncbi:hypothetical protein SETIT_1G328400v2 [Setaria italica]|uniref:Uncharacterized protein n=1 Tax=Setaria italica TaxID=4555 RepID=A0A368PS45_SETIT|nr:hypothetical protein SETIT_1G328400v2 [Setaria italica]